MLKITYSLLVALLFAAFLPAAAQAQYGPYKNGASVSGKASIDDKDLDNNTDVTFNFPMIGLAKSVSTPVAQPDGSYTFTYTLKVKNYGQLNLVKVQVRDTLDKTFPSPATYSVTSVTATGTLAASTTYTGAAATADLLNETASTLAIGDSATISVVVKLFNNNVFAFNNSATAYAETADATKVFDVSVNGTVGDANGNGNPFDDNAPTPLPLVKPDIAVTKTVDNATPYFGSTVEFKVVVKNNGPGNAANFKIKDLLPSGFTLVSAVPFTGTYNATSGEWTIPVLNPGDIPDTLTVKATVNLTGNYTNTAKNLIVNDGDVTNDEASVTVTPVAAANVSIVKTADNTSPYTGQQIKFTLTAANNGPNAATNVFVYDTLKQGYSLVTPLPSGVTYNATNHILTWTIGTLTNGQSVAVDINATVKNGFTADDYINRAIIKRDEYDPNTSNDTSVVIVTPLEAVDLVMEKSITAPSPLYAGNEVTFTLKVTNNGPSVATQVKVDDPLRPGYTFTSATPAAAYNSATGVWTIGTLTNGASATLTIKANIQATGSAYDYGNLAIASAHEFDSDADNNKDSIIAPTVTPLTDLKVVKTVDDANAHVGQDVTFTVTVTNNGPSAATGVKVTDALPNGFLFKSANPSTDYNSTSGVWTIGNLANGGTATLTMVAMVNPASTTTTVNYTNTAVVTGNETDPVTTNNTSDRTVTPVPAADLAVTKTVDKTTPDAGSKVVFTITATNNGLSNATQVVVTDVLKAGYQFDSAEPSGTTTFNSSNGEWAIGNLANGASATLKITAVVLPGKTAAEYANTATIAGHEADDNSTNNSAATSTTPVPVADLAITKTVSPTTSPDAGTDVTFTLLAENKGVSDATGVQVADLLPAGYTYKSHSTAKGTYTSGTGVWDIQTLAAGSNATLTIAATVKPNVTTAGAYKNIATISGTEKDPVSGNNSSSAETTPVEVADLAVVKTVDKTTPDVGGTVTFTVTVTNNGVSNATNVAVTDLLPDGYDNITATTATGAYDKTTGVWSIGALAVNATATLTVQATVKASGSYTNKATVTGTEKDPDNTNNASEVTPVPVPVADLSVTKAVDNSTPDKGTNVTFTITVTNNGLSTATHVKATDLLASGYRFSSATAEQGSYDDATGEWTIGSLASGASVKLSVTATVNATGIYSNTVTVTGTEKDPDNTNNTSTVTPVPVNITDLKLNKEVDNTTPDAGSDVVFTITVTNNGINDATGVTVNEKLKTGYTYKTSAASAGTYDAVAGVWTVGNLANGAAATLKITATVNASGDYSNTATVTGTEKDPDGSNNDKTITPVPVPVTDLAVTKSVDKTTPDVGSKVTFTVTVTNNGVSDATHVFVNDLLPDGYDNISAVATAGAYDKTTGVWSVGALAAHATATLTVEATVKVSGSYTNKATVTGAEKDPVPGNNSSEVTPVPVPVADLEVVKTVSNNTPDKGTKVTFTITVTNKGLSAATHVKATDLLASGYTFSDAAAEQGAYDKTSGEWTIGSLAAGASVKLTITATVNATGSYSNTATVTGTEKDPDGSNNSSTITPVPVDITDLVLNKEVDNATPDAGSNVVFTITVTNKGINDATGVTVDEKLRDGYTYLSATASAGTYDNVSGVWSAGNLAVGATATLKITARVNASGEYANTATVKGNEKDPVTDNNTKTVSPLPVAVTDLAVTKEVSETKPDAGSQVTFTVKVVNNGPSTASNVVVNEALPNGYTYVRHSVNTGTFQNGIWSVGVLDSGKTGELVITARVNASGNYLNVVTVSGSQKDSNKDNNTASATVEPVPVADMQITKTASVTGFNKDQQISFTLVARNNGASKANGIEVTDILKSGYTYVSMQTDNGTFDAATGVWKIASLDSGKEAKATMVVIAKATGDHTNTATVKATEKDNNTANNSSTVTLALNPDPVATDDAAVTEEPTPVTIKILDNDKALAGSLAPGTVVIKTQPQSGTVKVNADGTVTYTPAEGFEGTVTFTYTVKDSNGNESNVATVTVTVAKRKIDLAITKRIVTSHEQIEVGKNITFEIVVTNKSTKKASNVEVADILAANLGGNDVVLETQTGTAVYDAAAKRVTWTIGSMEGGATATLMVTAKVIAGGAVENTAVVSGSDEDADMSNNTATVSTTSGPDDLFIPNVITPNGDGKNDKFMILGLSAYPNSSIMIYNRWGNMVYQSSDYKNDWDGKGLNDGTYYFVLTVPKPSGKKVYKGWIQKLN